ncbi:MAG: hypothetical protein JWM28_3315, partial [Chitinophagaceae bacterium]|nr:hypothetical protein [Chitinophagaceae bacterium]
PTSLALFNEPAILILKKLIAAIIKMKKAIPKNIQEKTGFPSFKIPPSRPPAPLGSGFRCISVMGCRP